MKNILLLSLLFAVSYLQAQPAPDAVIDAHMQQVVAPTPDSLGRLIKAAYATDGERARAAYAWIVNHIAYNTAVFKPWAAVYRHSPDPLDTAAVWPSGDEMVARKVMRTGVALCDGYARLFKTVCDYAGVEAAIVQGFARGAGSPRLRTNHSWNAVRIDSVWHLLDATWASGYLTGNDDFIRQQNDRWYCTPPQDFLADHHPEQLRWTLLPNPSSLPEFRRSPFRAKNFGKYGIERVWPEGGTMQVVAGDTVEFKLQLKDVNAAKRMGNDVSVSTADWLQSPASVFLSPETELAKDLTYRWVADERIEWVHLTINSDMVLRYQVKVAPRKEGFALQKTPSHLVSPSPN